MFASKSSLLLKGVGVLGLQVDGVVSQGPQQEHGYRNTRHMDKFESAKELGCGMYPVQLTLRS
jgi:hypothetical protein